MILAIKDHSNFIFGAYATHPFYPQIGHYGTGECFLWKFDNSTSSIIKYKSTGKNDYFLMSENDYLAVGCGNGKFGLWLDKELLIGNSFPVPTFDNDYLASEPEFDLMALELWNLNY